MIVVIAGSRGIFDYETLLDAVIESGFRITEVVCGCCPNSPDLLGERFAKDHGIKITHFPADWAKHGRSAAFKRNREMAEYARANCPEGGGLIVLWNGISHGTRNMIGCANHARLKVFIKTIRQSKEAA